MFWGLFKNTKGKQRKKCPLLFTGWFKYTLNTSFIFCKKKASFYVILSKLTPPLSYLQYFLLPMEGMLQRC